VAAVIRARVRRGAVALVAVAALLLPASATPVLAAGATFGSGDAEVTYGEGITFTIPITVTGPLERVEARLRYPDSLGPFVEDVATPGAGEHELEYRLDLGSGGHIVPNTPIEITWAALAEGEDEPVLSKPQRVLYRDTSQDWRTLRGDVVTVHWYKGDDAFARRALDIGERAVRETSELLGVTESEPIDFFIYGDNDAFRTALGPGTRENVGGQAHADIRTLFGLYEPGQTADSWLDVLVPHELTHLVFDTAVDNPFRFPPRWVNEGLAVYLSEGYGPFDRGMVENAVGERSLMPLTALTGQFPTDPQKTSLAYAEAVSAIDFLVRTYDQTALLSLIDSYKEGLTDDEAFTRAVGTDVAGFQAAWLAELGAETPEAYGPVPNPPGPVPPGWDAPVPGQPTPAPGSSNAVPTARPGATGGPGIPGEPASGAGDTTGILVAIAAVVALVIGAMVVARRRTAPRAGAAGGPDTRWPPGPAGP
jgi:hypothetical protein